jgi:O-antigen/teichoic acid export membrane protein
LHGARQGSLLKAVNRQAAAAPGLGNASLWAFTSQIGRQAMQLATVVVLARLLSPDDFGLMAMVLVVTGFVGIFKDLGIGASLIQSRSRDPVELSSLYWTVVSITAVLTVTVLAVAPLIGVIFAEPRVVPLTQVAILSLLPASAGIVPQALLERDLRYKPVAGAELIGAVTGGSIGIGMAVLGFGVWSLVGQVLVMNLASGLAFISFAGFRPQARISMASVRLAAPFGAGLTGFNVLNYFSRNADYFLIGRFLGPGPLGFYTLAYRLMLLPAQNISSVATRVLFPALSSSRGDLQAFRSRYLHASWLIATTAFPIAAGLGATAPNLEPVLFGSRWDPAVPILGLLSIVAMMQVVGSPVGAIYLATARTSLLLRWGIVSSLVVVGGFVVGLPWGPIGVATAYLVSTFLLIYPSLAIPFGLIDLPVSALIRTVWRPLMCTVLMTCVVLAIGLACSNRLSATLVLGLQIGAGAASYVLATAFLNRDAIWLVVKGRGSISAAAGRSF